jgi:hypothetical protein
MKPTDALRAMRDHNARIDRFCAAVLARFRQAGRLAGARDPWAEEEALRLAREACQTLGRAKGAALCPACGGTACPSCLLTGFVPQDVLDRLTR